MNPTERATYQEHWRDLCPLLGEPTPGVTLPATITLSRSP